MEKDKIFFGESGLTTTSANFTANVAKELYRLLDEGLQNVIFYTTEAGLLSSSETKTLREGTDSDALSYIEGTLDNIAKLKSLIAWLREAMKAKARLIEEATNLSTEEVCEILGIELPKAPEKAHVPDEDEVIAAMNVKQRNRIYFLNTICAEIGSYIHIDGTLAKQRTELQKVLSERNVVRGEGRDAIIYSRTPTVSTSEVDDVYFKLQKKHREYQAEYNSILHGIQTTIQDAERKAILDYNEAYANYRTQMTEIQSRVKAYKDEQLTAAQNLKVIIPNDLKPIYDEVQAIGRR